LTRFYRFALRKGEAQSLLDISTALLVFWLLSIRNSRFSLPERSDLVTGFDRRIAVLFGGDELHPSRRWAE
jgi:hypothetical protein